MFAVDESPVDRQLGTRRVVSYVVPRVHMHIQTGPALIDAGAEIANVRHCLLASRQSAGFSRLDSPHGTVAELRRVGRGDLNTASAREAVLEERLVHRDRGQVDVRETVEHACAAFPQTGPAELGARAVVDERGAEPVRVERGTGGEDGAAFETGAEDTGALSFVEPLNMREAGL